MKFNYDLQGNSQIARDVPVYGAAVDIVKGAVVMAGATPGTDQGFAVVGAPTYADVLGVLEELHDYSVSGDSSQSAGTVDRRKVTINPFAVWKAEHDSATVIDVASTSGTTVTITSLEDNIDGGWLFAYSGTGAGSIYYITSSTSGECTTKTATGWDSTTKVLKIHPQFFGLVDMNTAGDKVKTAAAAGTGTVTILENYIEADGLALTKLDPNIHSGKTGLTNVIVSSDIVFRNHAFNTLD